MRKLILVAAATAMLGACDDGSPSDREGYHVTIELPPATPYVPEAGANGVSPSTQGRPKVEYAAGVCLGRWRSHFPRRGPSFTLLLDRDGAYRISGDISATGRWMPRPASIALGDGVLEECGREISHLTWQGGRYSLRRIR